MSALLVNGVDDELREALRASAERHGRSLEDEARDILRRAVLRAPEQEGGGFGSRFASHFSAIGFDDEIPEWRGRSATPATFDE